MDPDPRFVCPITHEAMRDPVTTVDGFTFEREAIARWFLLNHTSPMTNLPLRDKTLYANDALREEMRIAGFDVVAQSPAAVKARFPTEVDCVPTEFGCYFETRDRKQYLGGVFTGLTAADPTQTFLRSGAKHAPDGFKETLRQAQLQVDPNSTMHHTD